MIVACSMPIQRKEDKGGSPQDRAKSPFTPSPLHRSLYMYIVCGSDSLIIASCLAVVRLTLNVIAMVVEF